MDLKTFLSVLLVYRHNFQVLHWMAVGKSFFRIHEKSDAYHKMVDDDIDVVAEMILRESDEIVDYREALDLIDEHNHNFLLMSGKDLCDTDAFVEFSIKMFKDILECIEELLDSEYVQEAKHVGIKATLEGMHDKYDLQANYLLRRLKK